MRTFYRVSNVHTAQGLWYDFAGNFTGLIHKEFNFCTHTELRMDYDPELIGWLSATENLKDLWFWFPKEDIVQLEKHGWFINEYAVGESDIKWYDPFQHYVIRKSKSIFIRQIPVLNLG